MAQKPYVVIQTVGVPRHPLPRSDHRVERRRREEYLAGCSRTRGRSTASREHAGGARGRIVPPPSCSTRQRRRATLRAGRARGGGARRVARTAVARNPRRTGRARGGRRAGDRAARDGRSGIEAQRESRERRGDRGAAHGEESTGNSRRRPHDEVPGRSKSSARASGRRSAHGHDHEGERYRGHRRRADERHGEDPR